MGTPEESQSKAKAKPDAPSAMQYSYMFESNKSPTVQFDALLRAISHYIVKEIGDKKDVNLTPQKLAAFYKAVGGTYDSLFVENPHPAISYIWRITGCQHSLQPTEDDFAAPSIPALTFRGFSRWESLQVLLDPEEHVPFLQYAVKNWNLKHPDTGEPFPPDLPKDVFPSETDVQVDKWHQSCAEKLREEAGSKPEPERSGPKFAYVSSRNASAKAYPSQRHTSEHATRAPPPSYHHVPPGRHSDRRGSDPHPSDKDYREPSPREQEGRRSFSEYPVDEQPEVQRPAYVRPYAEERPVRPPLHRRHSHPRHFSDYDDSDDEPPTRPKRRGYPSPPLGPSVRRFVPPAPQPPPALKNSSLRAHRAEIRVDDHGRRSGPSPRGSLRTKLTETVSNILPSSLSDRPRTSSRNSSYDEGRPRRSVERSQPSRLARSYSDSGSESLGDNSSEDELKRRRRAREERDRGHRDRGRSYRDDVDDVRDSRRLHSHLQRPELQRRTSSHADIDRRRDMPQWDPHDRERVKDDRRKWDRRVQAERCPSPVAAGRRYPEPAYG
ncbi:hypothetical protein B0I35DRAFT_273930 [Stachybotrys elegans]|uniref:DUF7514 domain-containing protein n=1 Tax=Stachybotrys elegans TaxID=80388 RepID=A0A8K0SNK7_9HYPO|nr:hypothetical protein B0I35DRAFT_273930 [Stachybotrys elegans]